MPNIVWVPATVSKGGIQEQDELVIIEFSVPHDAVFKGKRYPVIDAMRPGSAFFARPFGTRTQKFQKRYYTRSNTNTASPLVLQTIINNTHDDADTSLWWPNGLPKKGRRIEVALDFDQEQEWFKVFEHGVGARDESKSLRLEPHEWWQGRKYLGITYYTGITATLAAVRHMAEYKFGNYSTQYVFIVSVRYPQRLMFHDELLGLERRFPRNFRYHPVLTKGWPENWPYTKGRIVSADYREEKDDSGKVTKVLEKVDLSKLIKVVPDIEERHIRLCGGIDPKCELQFGLEQAGLNPPSFKAEVW